MGCIGLLGASLFPAPAFGQNNLPPLLQKSREEPENLEVLAQLAMEYSLQQDFVKALQTNFRILKIDPENFHAYNNMGIIYKRAGQFKDSLACYENARRLKPDFYLVHFNIGLAYEAMGRMQEAREAYGRALSLNPEFSQALDRLRELTDAGTGGSPLPKPPKGKIWVADSPEGPPREYSAATADPPATKPAVKPASEAPPKATTDKPPEKPATPKSTSKSGATVTQKGKSEMVRTTRSGAGAPLYNRAMNALDEGNLPKAIEQYVSCLLLDRGFLAESDHGLIHKGLELLQDRPNSMSDGLFFRAFLLFISGKKEEAIPEFQQYIAANPKGPFFDKAQELVDQVTAEIEAAKEEEAARIAALKLATEPVIEEAATFTPRLGDQELAQKSPEEIIEEGKRLSREGRQRDAIAVIRQGLEKDRENLPLMMALANTYTDLMLLQGDKEAGKMARDLFERILRVAPRDSNEAMIARNMAQELTNRLR